MYQLFACLATAALKMLNVEMEYPEWILVSVETGEVCMEIVYLKVGLFVQKGPWKDERCLEVVQSCLPWDVVAYYAHMGFQVPGASAEPPCLLALGHRLSAAGALQLMMTEMKNVNNEKPAAACPCLLSHRASVGLLENWVGPEMMAPSLGASDAPLKRTLHWVVAVAPQAPQ